MKLSSKHCLSLLIIMILSCFLESVGFSVENDEFESVKRNIYGLVQYIKGDYPLAVKPGDPALGVKQGQIVSQDEYNEMVGFASLAKELYKSIVVRLPSHNTDPIIQNFEHIESLIHEKAVYSEIITACSGLLSELMLLFQLEISPSFLPAWELASTTFSNSCSSCHGIEGKGDGLAATNLKPPPKSFFEAHTMDTGSPFKFYNTLMTGIQGTSMRAFGHELSHESLWSVAFFVMGLRYLEPQELNPKPVWNPQAIWETLPKEDRDLLRKNGLSLSLLADLNDDDLWAWLMAHFPKAQSHPEKKHEFLRILRAGAPFSSTDLLQSASAAPVSSMNTHFKFILDKLSASKVAFESQNYAKALNEIVDAYLRGFEKIEVKLRVSDSARVLKIERLFLKVRALLKEQKFAGFVEIHNELYTEIQDWLTEYEVKSTTSSVEEGWVEEGFVGDFFSSFLIILREGFEAFLVIASLLALLKNVGARRGLLLIHLGWITAIFAGVATFFMLDSMLRYLGTAQQWIEALTSSVAVILLFYTGFWILNQVEREKWDKYLKQKTGVALSTGKLTTLFFMAFLAVYREAAETVLFYQALFSSTTHFSAVSLGFFSGVILLLVICYAIVKLNMRLPLRSFFMATSFLMVGLSVTLAGKAVRELIEIGILQPTFIESMPSFELLGLFPVAESLTVQALLIFLAAFLWMKSMKSQVKKKS